MNVKVYRSGGLIFAEEAGKDLRFFTPEASDLWVSGNQVGIMDMISKQQNILGDWTDIVKDDDTNATSLVDAVVYISSLFPLTVRELNGAIPVNVQDPTTDTIIIPMAQLLGSSTLSIEAVIDTYEVTVASSSGMTVGDHFRIINLVGDRFYLGTILGISVNVITLDNLIDFEYVLGSETTYSNINLAVDGSVTPIHFHLRTGNPSTTTQVDITRMIMSAQCDTAVDLNKFGDLPALEKGLLFRISNGHQRNIFNIKSNAGLVSVGYDWTPYDASHPTQAVDGFAWRLTFAGQDKVVVVIRVESDGQLGMIVQDDLTDLVNLFVMLEGHIVGN